MTHDEFLSSMKSKGATFAPASMQPEITLANSALQAMRAAMLPQFMMELYSTAGAINLGAGYIFGPTEWSAGKQYPVPNIVQINKEIESVLQMRGKTVFGRNDLFWFAFDAFGKCCMLDNINLRVLRQYDDPYRAMTDCLVAGKI